jgi:hypothetical protein
MGNPNWKGTWRLLVQYFLLSYQHHKAIRSYTKKWRKTVFTEKYFCGQKQSKIHIYKRKKVVFSFFRQYYTNFIFFTTYHKCMHKRFFLGRRKRMYTAVAVVGIVLPFLFLKDGFMSCTSFMLCCVLYIAMFCCCLVLI